MYKKITLLSLQTFSTTGGIQKMTRTLAYSLNTICEKNNWSFKLASLYDTDSDLMPQYLPAKNFKGYNKRSLAFVLKTIFTHQPDILILSHINLSLIGLLIKLINPKTKVWLITHGIEVWRPISFIKRKLLLKCDKVLCVSNFTKQKMYDWHKTSPNKCIVLNNALDPFMKVPLSFEKPGYLLNRYKLTDNPPIIFTLTRLASTELYKGHNNVIKAVSKLKNQFPGIIYILAGEYDEQEEKRVKELILDFNVVENVILTGFINEDELSDHFLLADVFVLPSKKEGFGIVFIEALACGLPVICGNADGSIDAICNGELGAAINADNDTELEDCIAKHLNIPVTLERRKYLKDKCLKYFHNEVYMDTILKKLINA